MAKKARDGDGVSSYMRQMRIVNKAKRAVERRIERGEGLPPGSVKILTGRLWKAMKSRFIAAFQNKK